MPMPTPTEIPLINVQYGGSLVTMTVRLPLFTLLLDATEADLVMLLPDDAPADANWGNAEAVLAAQTLLDARFPDAGYVVVSHLSVTP
jgi:hypothetical protein